MTVKQTAYELKQLAKQINYKKELAKDIAANDDKVKELLQTIKDAQDEIKALLAANEDLYSIQQEKKDLSKELNAGVKRAAKEIGVSAKDYKAFITTAAKQEEAVIKVVQKGKVFELLEGASR